MLLPHSPASKASLACTGPYLAPHETGPLALVSSLPCVALDQLVTMKHYEERSQLLDMGDMDHQSHSRGRRVDVLAHPLAVCLGALVSRLGLIHLDFGLWIHLVLCLFPLLGDLGGR